MVQNLHVNSRKIIAETMKKHGIFLKKHRLLLLYIRNVQYYISTDQTIHAL